jgi:hypothetical protein
LEKLGFDVFRELFLKCLSHETKLDLSGCSENNWLNIGDQETRKKVLESLNKRLKEDYDVEFEINQRLLSVAGPVESAVIQTFHELNTINIMERINAKTIARINRFKN